MSALQLSSAFDSDDFYVSSIAGTGTAFVGETIQWEAPEDRSTGMAIREHVPYLRKLTPRSLGEDRVPSVGYRPFQILQQWEGTVIESGEVAFVALLIDKTGPKPEEEEVEIDLDEITTDDKCLVRPGASFYWAIGYEDAPGVPRQRVSRIRFRRLPGWTRREIDRAEQAASRYESLFE